MLEVQEITKRYGDTLAVDALSFESNAGEIFGLLGPNGAGKSTTIRMIMNIIAPDSGSIFFAGSPLSEEDKNRIGYLPEERGLYGKVTVGDMLLYLASLKDVARSPMPNPAWTSGSSGSISPSGRTERSRSSPRGWRRRFSSSPRSCTTRISSSSTSRLPVSIR